jgi:hypothetical protein
MTRALPFTEVGLRRAISAARKAGLQVTGIRPDGTVIVNDGDNPDGGIVRLSLDGQATASSKWEDIGA